MGNSGIIIMQIFKNFISYTPTEINPVFAGYEVFFIKDENGIDWYESRKLFKDETLKIMVRPDGLIDAEDYDVYKMWPENHSVVELNSTESCLGKIYDFETNTVINKPLELTVSSTIKSLKIKAMDIITPLKFAEEIGIITKSEQEYLNKMKEYVVLLSRVQQQPGYPDNVEYPTLPTKK